MTLLTKPPSSYQILDGPLDHHFLLSDGLIVILQSTSSLGFYIAHGEFNKNIFSKALQDCIDQFKKRKIVEIKLIGSQALIDQARPLLSEDIRIKDIPKSGEFEVLFHPAENRTRLAPFRDSKVQDGANPPLRSSTEPQKKPVRVLIVDDSKTIRTLIKKIISVQGQIEVVGETGDPLKVMQLISEFRPDVITLDIHMPGKDGVTLLKEYIAQHPIPTIMITSVSREEGPMVLNALEAGAVDYINKTGLRESSEASAQFIDKVLSAAISKVKSLKSRPLIKSSVSTIKNLDITSIIAIGASTGGTEALRNVLIQLPPEIPPILIVQHIPAGFSNAFARRLDGLCPFEVLEAQDQDEIKPNRVLIAPGGTQMKAICRGKKWFVQIEDTPPVNRHKPSVDYLFQSLCEYDFKRPVGILLTGMGGDGAKGLLQLRQKGWSTIAQSKETCVVFGMPSVAIDLGAAEHICHLEDIPQKLMQLIPAKKSA